AYVRSCYYLVDLLFFWCRINLTMIHFILIGKKKTSRTLKVSTIYIV
ncbi:hypothetical protein PFHG_01793, partial [Plasmodium falciparum HB3]